MASSYSTPRLYGEQNDRTKKLNKAVVDARFMPQYWEELEAGHFTGYYNVHVTFQEDNGYIWPLALLELSALRTRALEDIFSGGLEEWNGQGLTGETFALRGRVTLDGLKYISNCPGVKFIYLTEDITTVKKLDLYQLYRQTDERENELNRSVVDPRLITEFEEQHRFVENFAVHITFDERNGLIHPCAVRDLSLLSKSGTPGDTRFISLEPWFGQGLTGETFAMHGHVSCRGLRFVSNTPGVKFIYPRIWPK